MTAKPEKRIAKTVSVTTPPFSGREMPSATAQCPPGYTCSGGGIDIPPDAIVVVSRLAEGGRGWFGSFTGGPSGGTATVRAICELEKPGPSESGELPWRVRWRR